MLRKIVLQLCVLLFFAGLFEKAALSAVEKTDASTNSSASILSKVERTDWRLEDAYKISTETREKICLNGIWNVWLRESVEFEKNNLPKLNFTGKTKKAHIRVPGEWYDSAWFSPTQYECLMPVEGSRGPDLGICKKVSWDGKPLENYYYALYEREFKVPKDWKKEEVFLRMDQINMEAWVFAGSEFAAHQVGAETRDIPLPASVKPGDNVKLKILVGAYVTGTAEKFAGAEMISTVKKESLSRGIAGDIWLVKRPSKMFISDIFIITSVREKQLKLRVEYSVNDPSGILEGKITPTGKKDVAKEFRVDLKEGKKLESGMYEYRIPWDNPVCWSPESPYLYDLHLSWFNNEKKLIDSCLPSRFGFRELWIQGVDYYLNGHPYRLRIRPGGVYPNEEAAKNTIAEYKDMGFNTFEISFAGYGDGYGSSLGPVPFLNKADEMGMLVLFILPGANALRYDWNKPGVKEGFQKTLSYCVKEVRKHPCLIHWSMNYNLLGYSFDMSPWHIATDYLPPDGLIGLGIKRVVWKDSEAMLRKLDDSRPILQHAGGNHGEISTSNMYLNFLRRQEKENWPMLWRTRGNKPFVAIELGTPYEATYFHAKIANNGDKVHYYSEPLYAEYCSMFYGQEAYSMESFERIKPIVESKVVPGYIDGSDLYEAMKTIFYDGDIRMHPFMSYLKGQCYLGEIFKSWRAWGVCGYDPYENIDSRAYTEREVTDGTPGRYDSFKTPGIKTLFVYKKKYKDKTILREKYKEWMSPELFYIGGPKNDFTDKQHSFRSGEKITKSIVWVNDTLADKEAAATLEVRENKTGSSIFKKELNMKAAPGEIQFNEVTFEAPEIQQQKIPFTMYLAIKEKGKEEIKDKFAMQVFPEEDKKAFKVTRKIWLIDGKGLTGSRLQELGVKYAQYTGGPLGRKDLLIVGRESLSELSKINPGIKESVRAGLNVILFEQAEKDLQKYCKLRTFESASRVVFLSQESHPVYKGLSDEDLADWNGKATLTEEFQKPLEDDNPRHIWRFGNQGIVSSVVIEKSHQGNFISLMHCEFDMSYTPLLEEKIGRGSIIFCQLDVTARTAPGPVTDIIAQNIIEYMDRKPINAQDNIVYAGASHGQDILDLTAVSYEKAKGFKGLPENTVIVMGDKGLLNNSQKEDNLLGAASLKDLVTRDKDALASHMKKGGNIVLLAVKDPGEIAAILGADVKGYSMEGYWFDYKKVEGITMGLSAGDLYWKDNIGLLLPDKKFPIAQVKVGNGKLVICQVDPLYFPDKDMNQRRDRSRQKTSRILSGVFANLGAASKFTSIDFPGSRIMSDIKMECPWKFRIDIDNKGLELGWEKKEWDSGYKMINVPASWESQGENTPNPNVDGKEPYDGYAWYQKSVIIPSSAKGIQLYSDMGAVDDYDWTYFNGKLIGNIGKETPNYWDARRYYTIPPELIQYDKPNFIAVRVSDVWQDGGIMKGPVRVTYEKKDIFLYLDSNIDDELRFDPYLFKRW